MISCSIRPSTETGKDRRIKLAGIDLLASVSIDQVFVYPSKLDIHLFKNALSHTLSLWPIVAGRYIADSDGHFWIEMGDGWVPVTFTVNDKLVSWPSNLNVVTDISQHLLVPFIDVVDVTKLLSKCQNEPLVRFKLTNITQSDECILGVSWSHLLGDAGVLLRFLNTISRFYQHLEPLEPSPIMERRLWKKQELDQSLLHMMRHLTDTGSPENRYPLLRVWHETHQQLNLLFSGEQLAKLRELAGGQRVTIQDSLSAYIILTLNIHCYQCDNKNTILRANTIVNFRGVSDAIASPGNVSNSVFRMLSDDFENPFSLESIAITIRHSIIRSRDPDFLIRWLATADNLMRQKAIKGQSANWDQSPNEVTINSNLKYNWNSFVDFGHHNQCRLHVVWTGPRYIRVFRQNPVFKDGEWLERDENGAEAAFLIETNLKEKFLHAWQKDVRENFQTIKQYNHKKIVL